MFRMVCLFHQIQYRLKFSNLARMVRNRNYPFFLCEDTMYTLTPEYGAPQTSHRLIRYNPWCASGTWRSFDTYIHVRVSMSYLEHVNSCTYMQIRVYTHTATQRCGSRGRQFDSDKSLIPLKLPTSQPSVFSWATEARRQGASSNVRSSSSS